MRRWRETLYQREPFGHSPEALKIANDLLLDLEYDNHLHRLHMQGKRSLAWSVCPWCVSQRMQVLHGQDSVKAPLPAFTSTER